LVIVHLLRIIIHPIRYLVKYLIRVCIAYWHCPRGLVCQRAGCRERVLKAKRVDEELEGRE